MQVMYRNGNRIITPHIISLRSCVFIYAKWVLLLGVAVLFGQRSLADGRGEAWPVHVIDSGLSGGDGVRLFDVDSDGDMDVAVGQQSSGSRKANMR
jgi:hypothetical protein